MAKKNPYLNDSDILDQALEHSWGKTADAKAKEKAYNREYYQRHKEEILRKARQAGEGIQREARGIKEAITGTSRRYSSNKELHSNYPDTRTTYGYGPDRYGKDAFKSNLSNRRRLEEAKSDYDRYRNTPGASQTKERVRKAASKHSSTAAAINEREKAYRQVGPESKFDSKLVRDAQNAYSKVRPGIRKAKNAAEDAINTAKNNTQAYIDNAMGKNGRRGSNIDTRQLEIDARKAQSKRNRINNAQQKAEKRADARWEQYQGLRQINPNSRFTKDADHAYTQAITQANQLRYPAKKSRQQASASAAAYNQAQNAANRPGYDTRYDSAIVRGMQNTKAKARGTAKKAKDSVDQFVNNALSKTKKKKKS